MKLALLIFSVILLFVFGVFLFLGYRSIGYMEDKLEMAQHDLDLRLDLLRHDLNVCEWHIKSMLKESEVQNDD